MGDRWQISPPVLIRSISHRFILMANILLTEDDDAVRSFVARALEMEGHTLTLAEDGEDGFDKLQEAEGQFDLLLTDIKMPFMDGIELARLSASLYPGLRILFMTGFADQRERTGDLADIVIDVVSKPFTLAQIKSAVSHALEVDTSADLKEAS